MIKYALTTINWISDFGVSPNHPEENDLIRSYNLMSLLSALGIIAAVSMAYSQNFSPTYIAIASSLLIIYIGALIANYLKKHYTARYWVAILSPFCYNVIYLLIGGYFGQGLACIASMAITYVAFQKRPFSRNVLIVYHIAFFFASFIYVQNFGVFIEWIDFAYDELFVFAGGLGWAVIVFISFNKDRTKLLNFLKANNEELKSTTEELERFTYIASHDLKSPLRTIISFIGLIERDIKKGNIDRIQENLNFVKSGAEQMNFLVQDILEMSKVNNFEGSIRNQVDLYSVFEKARMNLKRTLKTNVPLYIVENYPRSNAMS